MSNWIFKVVYFTLGSVITLLAFNSFLNFISSPDPDQSLSNGLMIFLPVLLSGILVVISSVLLFLNEREKIKTAISISTFNIWFVSIIFLIIMLANLVNTFADYKFLEQRDVVLFVSLFIYPILIATLALGHSKLKGLSSEVSTTKKPHSIVDKLATLAIVIVVIFAVLLLANLMFPSFFFGEAVGMSGWAVVLFLGTILLLLAPVLIFLAAVLLRRESKNQSSKND